MSWPDAAMVIAGIICFTWLLVNAAGINDRKAQREFEAQSLEEQRRFQREQMRGMN